MRRPLLGSMGLLAACTGAARMPVATPANPAPSPVSSAAQLEAPAPTHREPAVAARDDGPFSESPVGFWLVPKRGGGSECWRMRAEPIGEAGRGVLVPDWDHRAWEIHRDAHRNEHGSAPFPVAHTVLGFDYHVDGDRITVSNPATWRTLSECQATRAQAAFPWFSSAEQCQAARAERSPMDFETCADTVAFYAEQPEQTRFDRIVTRGGTVWERRGQGCVSWAFTPRGRADGDGTVVATTFDPRTGRRAKTERYGYEFDGTTLVRSGPRITEWRDGKRIRGPYVRCYETDPVLHDQGPVMQVGAMHWYHRRHDCEAAPPPLHDDDGC